MFQDVQHRRDPKYIPKNPNVPFPNKPSASNPRYAHELERRGLTRLHIPIKAIGVWDTVGSLGTPRIGWLTKFGLQSAESDEVRFYDTKLSNCIENAFQALALDEKRSAFSPALWEKPEGNKTTLRQVWFPGVHSNVGGGMDDQQLANITLAWMMSQLEPFLDMRDDYLFEQDDENAKYYRKDRQDVRPWSFGEIENSASGVYALGGGRVCTLLSPFPPYPSNHFAKQFRTPGFYHAVDPYTGRHTDRPLRQTNEYIHPSVRTRIRLNGPGVSDRGPYDCRPLTDSYKLVIDYGPNGRSKDDNGTSPDIFWKLRFRDDDAVKILPEAPLWRLERELCMRDARTWEYVRRPPATGIGKEGRGSRRGGAGQRPVSVALDGSERRREGGGGQPRRSFMENGGSRHSPRLGPGDGRKSFPADGGRDRERERERRREHRSRSRAMSMDRETEFRESMPHRRAKDRTWWDAEEEEIDAGRGGGSRYDKGRLRSPGLG